MYNSKILKKSIIKIKEPPFPCEKMSIFVYTNKIFSIKTFDLINKYNEPTNCNVGTILTYVDVSYFKHRVS